MIEIMGRPFYQVEMWPTGSLERIIIQRMVQDRARYSYASVRELSFELELRKNIIWSARALHDSRAQFEVFARSRCNPEYWLLTPNGGFRQRPDVRSSDAIRDIFINSDLYAFECATAKVIIYYHATLQMIGDQRFNQLFPQLYLYSWHFNPNLGLRAINTYHFIPGDVVYFINPDFDIQTPQWRGMNAVVLEDGRYFGHGLEISTAEGIIDTLNQWRNPGAVQTAYLSNVVVRPDFHHLYRLSRYNRERRMYMNPLYVVNHNESSISFDQYMSMY